MGRKKKEVHSEFDTASLEAEADKILAQDKDNPYEGLAGKVSKNLKVVQAAEANYLTAALAALTEIAEDVTALPSVRIAACEVLVENDILDAPIGGVLLSLLEKKTVQPEQKVKAAKLLMQLLHASGPVFK